MLIFTCILYSVCYLDQNGCESISPPCPLNARLVSSLVNSSEGGQHRIQCDDGFELFGSPEVTCKGKWNSSGYCGKPSLFFNSFLPSEPITSKYAESHCNAFMVRPRFPLLLTMSLKIIFGFGNKGCVSQILVSKQNMGMGSVVLKGFSVHQMAYLSILSSNDIPIIANGTARGCAYFLIFLIFLIYSLRRKSFTHLLRMHGEATFLDLDFVSSLLK